MDQEAVNSVTRGLVGDTSFAVLPDIVPLTCFLLTLGAQIVRTKPFLKMIQLMLPSLSFSVSSTSPPGKLLSVL